MPPVAKANTAPPIKVKTFGISNNFTVFFAGTTLEVAFNNFSTKSDLGIPANEFTIGDSNTIKPGDLLSIEPLQLHFHTPSEHTIDGVLSPGELHIVCKIKDGQSGHCDSTEKGCLVVFGINLRYSRDEKESNEIIDFIFSELPTMMGRENGVEYEEKLDLDVLLPAGGLGYFTYLGSLTTPPCSEIVTWHVFEHSIPISVDQVVAHQRLVSSVAGEDCKWVLDGRCTPGREKTNNRLVQPLEGRDVYFVKELEI